MKNLRILIPITIVGIFLVNCWTIIFVSDILATWRHYVGLILFIGIGFLFFRNINMTTIVTGIFLLLGTFNALAMTPEINTSWFAIGPIETPSIQLLSLGLFIIYFVLNLDPLINIYLDYKESNQK